MKKLLLLIIIASITFISPNIVLAVNDISIGNYTIETGTTLRLPIYLNNSDNISGFGIKLSFDPAVVNITSLAPTYLENETTFNPGNSVSDGGNFTFFYAVDSSSPGVTTINTFKIGSGLNGSQIIGYVRMQAVGSTGDQ